MLIVEFRVDSPILQKGLTDAPETTVSYEEQYRISDGIALLFWAEGGDLTAFEEGLSADPTVTDVNQLAKTETRHLYRVTFTERGESVATFPSWAELNISLLDATATHEGQEIRMRMPNRNALEQYREVCEANELQFRLEAIYEESEATSMAEARLTNRQREALVTARELGYFEVPRRASSEDIAAQCGVTSQAISERIRRGTATLIDVAL